MQAARRDSGGGDLMLRPRYAVSNVKARPRASHEGIDFEGSCTLQVAKRIQAAIDPLWLRIGGYWYPRGGMPIDIFYQTGAAPEGIWLPDQGVSGYRGRG